MKKFRTLTALVAILAFGPLQAVEIVTVGDSITSGVKVSADRILYCPPDNVTVSILNSIYFCNGDGVANSGGFQPDIRTQLASIGVSSNVYNFGWAGEESWQIVSRVTQAMSSRASEFVFLMAGVNDLNDNVSAQTTIFNIQQMAQNVINNGRTPVIATVTPYPVLTSYTNKILAINAGLISYANANNIAVADAYALLASGFQSVPYHSGDRLHLNDAGDSVVGLAWRQGYQQSIAIAEELARLERAKRSIPAVIVPVLLSD
ncbi:MAG: SGNH/GDSL hydrolase family protein [Pseudomonadota bacterium]